MTGRESVVLAGSSQLLLIGIKQVVEATDRFEVVSQAHASELALTLARQLRPDYVILDETERSHRTIEEEAGVIDTLHGLGKLSKPPGVLVVVAQDQFRLVQQLRRAGCRACVSNRSADTVVRALDMLSLGREFLPEWRNARRREHTHGASQRSRLPKGLNRNEVEILALMARGYSSKEIAARVGLAVGTVNNYRRSVKVKLGAGTRAEIRRAARTAGLLASPDLPDRSGERRPGGIEPEQGSGPSADPEFSRLERGKRQPDGSHHREWWRSYRPDTKLRSQRT